MPTRYCKHCDRGMEFVPDEPDVGIVGGWFCTRCEISVPIELSDFDDSDLDRPVR